MKQQQRLEATEDRRLQSKALRAWEKQKVAWEQMRHRLLTETGKGGRERGIARNFAMSAATTRERMEDYGMISAGVPQSALNSFYAWESLLRRTNESEALRYVQIGKGYYPYALFGEVRDPTAIKKSHPVFTRVVHDIPRGPLGEESEEGVLASARRSRDVARTAISMENEEDGMRLIISSRGGDDLLMTSTNTDAQMDYYTQQLRRFAPHLKSRFSHFLVPRDFLQVEGGPVPFLSQREAEQMQAKMMEEGEEEEDPVQFFPPPQQIRISSALGATSQPSGSAPNTRKGEDERSTAGLSEGDGAQGSGLVGTGTAISEEEAAPTTVPSLRISTRRLLFRAQPGELTHGYVVVDNPSSVTVYYSWMPVDLMQEGVAEEAEEEHRRPATSASADGSAGHGTPRAGSPRGTAARAAPAPAPPIIPLDEVRRCVHRMADKSRMARSYFRLSSPINGVFLPDDSEVFPFSLRSPHPGRFKHTFELLTVPPSPERIIIELSAIVEANETSADTLYKPVEAALNAKVAADAQRSLVHRLLNNNTPYEGAEIENSIKAVHEAKEKAQQADKARNTSQKQRWHAANQHTLDLTPYNRQVYEKLAKLYTNLHQAMEGLGMAQSHTHWDGSINSLISDVVDLRDAPSRNLYHEAIMVLLRAARVSQNDAEPLEVLLQRAAEELANHVGKRLLVMHAEEAEFSQLPREPIVPVMSGKKARAMSAAGKRHASAGGPGGVGAKNDKNAPIDVPQPGTLRRSSKVVWTAEEQEALDQELDVLIATRTALVEGEGPARAAMYLASFRRLVDAACDLHLLDVVQGSRVADLRTLQTFDEMEVDTNAEIVIQKPTKKR